jgi:preprotein translocase subunit SecG
MSPLILVKTLWTFSCVSLMVLVLLHSPKGDGLGGLGGQAQLFTSTKSAEKTLNQLTWVLVTMFMSLTTVLSAGLIK